MARYAAKSWTSTVTMRFAATLAHRRVFRHNHLRDILGHAARGAGLSAVVIEKKNQITGTSKKPGQQYHRGFASTAFDVTVAHPLQKKHQGVAMDEAGVAAEEAHDNKLKKHLEDCKKEGLQFVPLAWESTGGATATVHKTLGKWTGLESERRLPAWYHPSEPLRPGVLLPA